MVQINKITTFIVFLLVASPSLIYATQETDWLIQEYDKRDRGIEESALAVLAVNKQLGSPASLSSAVAKLKSYLDSCIQANNCNNKDVALAIWALKEVRDTSPTLDAATNWLINSRTIFAPDTEADDWLLQIISPVSGSCAVNNTETKIEKTISVSAGYTPWQSVKDLVTQNTNDLAIDCTSLSSVNSISLIKKKTVSNIINYFIIEEIQNQRSVRVQLGVQCWGPTYRSICNQDTAAYVLLALNKQGKNPDPAWLEQQDLAPLENAVLYKITNKQGLLSTLQSSQSPSGFWQPVDVVATSLIYSLIPSESQAAKKALAWLQGQKAPEGCWPRPLNLCDLKSTAAAVYALAQSVSTATSPPGNTTRPSERTALDDCDEPCLDRDGCICPANECKRSFIENDETCEGPKSTTTSPQPGTYCVTERLCDGQLDRLGRCIDIAGDNCPEEEVEPGDETSGETDGEREPVSRDKRLEVEEETSILFWVLMVVAASIALIGGSFLDAASALITFLADIALSLWIL